MDLPLAPSMPRSNPLDVLQGVNPSDKSAARAAAEEFEAVFLNNMLQSMFSGLENGGAWGGGTGSDAWQGMLVDEYARTISAAGGVGIADSVERELLALQEGAR
ncbi:rod-binding protein [Roseibium sp.]|jgi:Rod binding domain-containing protein|uniref:rod-binding protein n=1 Tax=Roseibium sp. TaxID=1936156 RepID=UPI0010EEB301